MPSPKSEPKQLKVFNNKEANVLRNLLHEPKSAVTFTPLQILLLSIGYIFVVYMLHILIKIFPSTSPVQMLVAIIVLCSSIIVSAFLNKL